MNKKKKIRLALAIIYTIITVTMTAELILFVSSNIHQVQSSVFAFRIYNIIALPLIGGVATGNWVIYRYIGLNDAKVEDKL